MIETDILAKLVGFDTTSARSNLMLIGWIGDYLSSHDIHVHTFHNGAGDKAGLIASIGPATPGGVLLAGHTDTVPVDGQTWSQNPFELRLHDGRYYGRGTTDMKGFLSTVLGAVPAMVAAPLRRPIHIVLTYDEEIGCFGATALAKEMRNLLPPIEAVIVGEPTGMRIVDRHMGAYAETIEFIGVGVHSSQHESGVSAINHAAGFADELLDLTDRNGRVLPGCLGSPGAKINLAQIQGGTAHNIVADRCSLQWSMRSEPTGNPQALIKAVHQMLRARDACMRQAAPQCGVRIRVDFDVPPLQPETTSRAVAVAVALTGRNSTAGVDYCTEAGLYQSAGYSTVVMGPGDISQAHTADEYITQDQLHQCRAFVDRLITYLST